MGYGEGPEFAESDMSFEYRTVHERKASERNSRRIQAILDHGVANGLISADEKERYRQLRREAAELYTAGKERKSLKLLDESGRILEKSDPDGSVNKEQHELSREESEKDIAEMRKQVDLIAQAEKLDIDTAYYTYHLRTIEEDLRTQAPELPDAEELKELIRKYELLPRFIEGGNPGPFYSIAPVKVKSPIQNENKDVKRCGKVFSVDDQYFCPFLSEIFIDAFNKDLPINRQRYTTWEKPDTKRFDYYAIHNFYTAQEMARIADTLDAAGKSFRNNEIEKIPYRQLLRLRIYQLKHAGYRFLEESAEYRAETASFYAGFSQRIRIMISQTPDAEYYSLDGL